MSLPNPGMSFTPFDPLPASDLNDIVENVEALAAGTGLENGAVTPVKRAGGFYIGQIAAATLGSTGNKAITGVGFTPKLVRFILFPTASTVGLQIAYGAMTPASQYYVANATDSTTNRARNVSTSACIAWLNAGSSTPALLASYVSMDADGFTINVATASSTFAVSYEAYA